MKAVSITTTKWKGLKVGQVVEHEGEPYVIIAIGMGKPRYWDGSLTVDLILQGANEIPNQSEEQFATSTEYMHTDEIKIDVGQFGIMDDGLLVRIIGIKDFKWVMTDLAIKYVAQAIPGWSPVKVNKIIKEWRKKDKRVPVLNSGSKVVRFNFRKADKME